MRWPWDRQTVRAGERSPEDFGALLERFAESPEARRLAAEQEREDGARRQALREELDRLRAEERAELDELREQEAAAGRALEQAEAALRAARTVYAEAAAAVTVAGLRRSAPIARLEAGLRGSAPEEIAAFLGWLRAEEGKICAARPRVIVESRLDGLVTHTATDGAAIPTALEVLRRLRRQAEALTIEVLSPDELRAKLAAMRDELEEACAAIGVLEDIA